MRRSAAFAAFLLASSAPVPGAAQISQDAGQLVVTTDPPGATVYVDGEPRGPSPIHLTGLPFATYSVVAVSENRTSEPRQVEVRGSAPSVVHLVLAAATPPPRVEPAPTGTPEVPAASEPAATGTAETPAASQSAPPADAALATPEPAAADAARGPAASGWASSSASEAPPPVVVDDGVAEPVEIRFDRVERFRTIGTVGVLIGVDTPVGGVESIAHWPGDTAPLYERFKVTRLRLELSANRWVTLLVGIARLASTCTEPDACLAYDFHGREQLELEPREPAMTVGLGLNVPGLAVSIVALRPYLFLSHNFTFGTRFDPLSTVQGWPGFLELDFGLTAIVAVARHVGAYGRLGVALAGALADPPDEGVIVSARPVLSFGVEFRR